MIKNIIAWPKSKNRLQNPYQYLLYSAVEKKSSKVVYEFSFLNFLKYCESNSILHIHWPDVFLATSGKNKFWIKLLFLKVVFFVCRVRGTKIVWTAHNIKRAGQRNFRRLDRYFWEWFVCKIDAVIYMTETSRTSSEKIFPVLKKIPSSIIPHGHYKPVIESIKVYNKNFNDNIPRILFFGSITKYKNVNKLLEAFLELPVGTAKLAIKGKMSKVSPDNILLDRISKLHESELENVDFEDRFLTEQELLEAINSSDLIVFPYSDVLNSGAAIYALSAGKPILASQNSLFRELQTLVGADFVMLIENELNDVVIENSLANSIKLKATNRSPDLSNFDWELIGEKTLSFYAKLLDCET